MLCLNTPVLVAQSNNYPEWITDVQTIIETSTRTDSIASQLKVRDLKEHLYLLDEKTLGVLAHGVARVA